MKRRKKLKIKINETTQAGIIVRIFVAARNLAYGMGFRILAKLRRGYADRGGV